MSTETHMFKIKHIPSGQYVKKSSSRFRSDEMHLSAKGKTWNSIGAVKGHIRINQTHYSKHANEYELVELRVTEADGCKIGEVIKVMNEVKEKKELAKKRRYASAKEKREKENKLRLLRAERENLDKMIEEIESK